MRLWTWHPPGFSILTGKLDRSLSPYARDRPAYLAACAELAARIGTEQFIFCCTHRGQWSTVKWPYLRLEPEVEWVLEVPYAQVLALIDGAAWDHAIRHASGRQAASELPAGLLCEGPTTEDAQALIPFPVDSAWVLEVVPHEQFAET
jgi:hypothetical protein